MAPKKAAAGGYPAAKAATGSGSKKGAAAGSGAAAESKKADKAGADGKASKGAAAKKQPEQSQAAAKAAKRADKEAQAAARQREVDAMLMPDVDESEESEEDLPVQPTKLNAAVKMGAASTPSKQPQSREQRAQEKECEERNREMLRQQREERLAERERERAEKEAKAAEKKDTEMAALLEKVEKQGVGKLSNKERRAYSKYLEQKEERERELATQNALAELDDDARQLEKELEDLSATIAGGSEPTEGAVDLRLENFCISAGGQRLLEDADLTLAQGRRYGLLGPNGGGKTTLLKLLAGKRLPVPATWIVGLVQQEARATETPVVDEVLAADATRRKLLAEEAELLAKLDAFDGQSNSGDDESLVLACERLAAVAAELDASGAEAAEARVRRILCGLGFTTEMAEGPVSRLSGGWRMRVSLAKALFLEPHLLLLDEPTNHLDLDAVLWLDEYLNEYKKTVLVVSHDADFLDSACTDIVHVEERKLHQYRGGYTEFRKAHAHRLREREKQFQKQQEDKKAGKKLHPDDLVQKVKDYIVKFRFLPPLVDGDDAGGISVHDANFSYSGKKPWLLDELNFRIDTSTRVAVVGANGAGKSTLLNLMAKVVEPCNGDIQHSRRLTIGRYSQHFDEIAPALHLSGVEFLTSHELRRFGAGTESPELAHKCLGQFGLPSHAHGRPMKELSGGQKARVCFASITCRRPEILILDEPTNHLDIESVEALIDALKIFKGGLMLVSHDARLIKAAGCDLWICKGPGESIGKAPSFEEYRRDVLKELARRQARAEAEAARRTEARRRRRAELMQRGRGRGSK